MSRQQQALFDAALLRTSAWDAVKKLDPRVQFRNPVMFVVYLGSIGKAGAAADTSGQHRQRQQRGQDAAEVDHKHRCLWSTSAAS